MHSVFLHRLYDADVCETLGSSTGKNASQTPVCQQPADSAHSSGFTTWGTISAGLSENPSGSSFPFLGASMLRSNHHILIVIDRLVQSRIGYTLHHAAIGHFLLLISFQGNQAHSKFPMSMIANKHDFLRVNTSIN